MVQDGPFFPRYPGYFSVFPRATQFPLTDEQTEAFASLLFGQKVVEVG